MLLAIDPGTTQSAWVLYNLGAIVEFGITENNELRAKFDFDKIFRRCDRMAIEMIASYGMPVGKEVFETCLWIGRFIELWLPHHAEGTYTKVYRKDVKMCLCNSTRAKDSNIRQAILDRYPPTGGGKCPQVGTKNNKGPLYGVSKDVWAAIGVAITFSERIT